MWHDLLDFSADAEKKKTPPLYNELNLDRKRGSGNWRSSSVWRAARSVRSRPDASLYEPASLLPPSFSLPLRSCAKRTLVCRAALLVSCIYSSQNSLYHILHHARNVRWIFLLAIWATKNWGARRGRWALKTNISSGLYSCLQTSSNVSPTWSFVVTHQGRFYGWIRSGRAALDCLFLKRRYFFPSPSSYFALVSLWNHSSRIIYIFKTFFFYFIITNRSVAGCK